MQLHLDSSLAVGQHHNHSDVSTPALAKAKCMPLLKWPGGKRALLPHILPLIPNDVNSYYEPFLGGGALYFALQPPDSFLSDTNPDLINCYLQVRKRPEELTTLLAGMRNSEADYYRVRSEAAYSAESFQ